MFCSTCKSMVVSLLVSGLLWSVIPLFLHAWPVSLLSMMYVMVTALWFGLWYRKESFTRKEEAVVWLSPWLLAIALFTFLLAGTEPTGFSWVMLLPAIIFGTLSYGGWHWLALALRQNFASEV